MPFELPQLPYAKDALLPHISVETFSYHYDKHHSSYVDKLNAAIEGTDYEGMELMELIHAAYDNGDQDVFNNAAQTWNHTFFWQSMSPDNSGVDDAALERLIDDFGGMDALREAFVDSGTGQFGSGWVWIVVSDGKLDVVGTPNAELPQLQSQHPLLTCDLWEHAYYLDYQNERGEFLEVFFDRLANWRFAADQLRRQGEGDYTAAKRFQNAQAEFAKSGDVENAAREAQQSVDGEEGRSSSA